MNPLCRDRVFGPGEQRGLDPLGLMFERSDRAERSRCRPAASSGLKDILSSGDVNQWSPGLARDCGRPIRAGLPYLGGALPIVPTGGEELPFASLWAKAVFPETISSRAGRPVSRSLRPSSKLGTDPCRNEGKVAARRGWAGSPRCANMSPAPSPLGGLGDNWSNNPRED